MTGDRPSFASSSANCCPDLMAASGASSGSSECTCSAWSTPAKASCWQLSASVHAEMLQLVDLLINCPPLLAVEQCVEADGRRRVGVEADALLVIALRQGQLDALRLRPVGHGHAADGRHIRVALLRLALAPSRRFRRQRRRTVGRRQQRREVLLGNRVVDFRLVVLCSGLAQSGTNARDLDADTAAAGLNGDCDMAPRLNRDRMRVRRM